MAGMQRNPGGRYGETWREEQRSERVVQFSASENTEARCSIIKMETSLEVLESTEFIFLIVLSLLKRVWFFFGSGQNSHGEVLSCQSHA